MIKNYNGGPVGLDTIAAAIGEESVTIEDVYEPYLMQIGSFQERREADVLLLLRISIWELSNPVNNHFYNNLIYIEMRNYYF